MITFSFLFISVLSDFLFFYPVFFIFFRVFYSFLQVKSQFRSRSSLNAGKTEKTRKIIEKEEELGANQSTKLKIASKMMMEHEHEKKT